MAIIALSRHEIIIRLVDIHTIRRELITEESELLARLQRPKGDKNKPPVELTFGKGVISWGNGQALPIRGKGYKFLKALYYADKMRSKEATLDKIVWKGKVNHRTFTVFVRRLAERLEGAKFPYQLLPVESKPAVKPTGQTKNEKPVLRFVPCEIIGVRLRESRFCTNVPGNS